MAKVTEQEIIEALEIAADFAERFLEDWSSGLDEGLYQDQEGFDSGRKDMDGVQAVLKRLREG